MKEGKVKVFISSPYTLGDTAVNVRRQIDMSHTLMNKGYSPFVPLFSHFQHMIHPRPYEDWMELDFDWLGSCDCILRLPGESSGADREVEHAKKLSLPVFYSLDELESFYGTEKICEVAYRKGKEDCGLPNIQCSYPECQKPKKDIQ